MSLGNRLEGAMYGAMLMGIIGQVPPLTVLPEEIVSIPAGAMIGFVLGRSAFKRIIPRF